jgi:hypothetical protein
LLEFLNEKIRKIYKTEKHRASKKGLNNIIQVAEEIRKEKNIGKREIQERKKRNEKAATPTPCVFYVLSCLI